MLDKVGYTFLLIQHPHSQSNKPQAQMYNSISIPKFQSQSSFQSEILIPIFNPNPIPNPCPQPQSLIQIPNP